MCFQLFRCSDAQQVAKQSGIEKEQFWRLDDALVEVIEGRRKIKNQVRRFQPANLRFFMAAGTSEILFLTPFALSALFTTFARKSWVSHNYLKIGHWTLKIGHS